LIEKFLELHPFDEIYMTGESYAGKYIPWFTNYLVEKGLNIKGVSMGNAWVAP